MTHSSLTGFLTADGSFRVIVADTADLANHVSRRHGFSYRVADAMSRFLTGSALLSSNLKEQDVMGTYLESNGAVEGLRVEINAVGQAKAYALNPEAGVDEIDDQYVMDLPELIGSGKLTVTRILKVAKTPYSGTVDVHGGDIAIAFSTYLLQSEQVKSAMLISNYMEPDGTLSRCGGLLIQAMPGATEEQLDQVEAALRELPAFSEILKEADTALQVVQLALPAFKVEQVLERPLVFACSCSREKVVQVLKSMSESDRQAAAQEDGTITVTCDYCREEYTVGPEALN